MDDTWNWLGGVAAKLGLTYERDSDERWLRAFEPFATLRTPLRYEHALHSTGAGGSISVARLVVERSDGREASAWIALVQDDRLPGARAAAANDPRPVSPFAESADLVSLPPRKTGDEVFDRAFATYGPTENDVDVAITPSVRKLVLSWRIPVHFEVRPGVFVLAPVTLRPDPASLEWFLGAVRFFGEKAAKRVK